MNDNNTSVETTRVNRLSDHDFLLALAYLNQQGQTEYGFPPYDWEFKFYTSSPLNFFTVSCRGGVMLNCQREGDMVRVIMDGHKLSTGVLRARSTIYIPDSNFPDGTRRVVDEHEFKTLFVSGHGTLASGPQLELLFPYVKGEPGKPFTYDDFTSEQLEGLRGPKGESLTFSDLTPEQIEELRGPQGEPFTYDDFTPEQLEGLRGPQGESLTYDDLTPGQIAELQRPATEAAQLVSSAIDDVTATNTAITKAEQTRVAAEQARVDAEQERAREFAGFAQDIDNASLRLFDLQWEQAGGSVIVSGETYGLNGINDLSLTEAIEILSYKPLCDSPNLYGGKFSNLPVRTLLPIRSEGWTQDLNNTFSYMGNLEVIQFALDWIAVYNAFNTFSNCNKLREIKGRIGLRQTSSSASCEHIFADATALEEVRVQTAQSLNLRSPSRLSLASMQYLVANASNGAKVITVTVHPDVYAKLTGDTTNAAAAALTADELAQWQAILAAAAAKNITIATP